MPHSMKLQGATDERWIPVKDQALQTLICPPPPKSQKEPQMENILVDSKIKAWLQTLVTDHVANLPTAVKLDENEEDHEEPPTYSQILGKLDTSPRAG